MENNRSKDKAARYAIVYNKILQMIEDGMYPEGSKLVSEPILAQQMDVSRSTLRQALNLLQEDGIIEARRGVGNFVRKTIDINATGLEKMDHPLYKSCIDDIKCATIEIIPGISTEYTQRIFQRKMPMVLAIHRYYKQNQEVHAYCFSHIASDWDYLNSFDLHDQTMFLEFMESGIYKQAHARKCEIKVVHMTDNLEDKQIVHETDLFQMIHETISDVHGQVVAVNKYYIPIEKALLKVYSNSSI